MEKGKVVEKDDSLLSKLISSSRYLRFRELALDVAVSETWIASECISNRHNNDLSIGETNLQLNDSIFLKVLENCSWQLHVVVSVRIRGKNVEPTWRKLSNLER